MKSDFAMMCRELRVQKGLKQREVAERIGVKTSTYGNIECSEFKVIRAERVSRLIALYQLAPDRASAFSAAWARCPLSPYGEKQRKTWETRNKQRSKAKNHDRMQWSLCLVLGVHIGLTDSDKVCVCQPFGGDPCEVCEALTVLGLDTYTTREVAIDQLSKLQGKLEAARAAAAGKAAL